MTARWRIPPPLHLVAAMAIGALAPVFRVAIVHQGYGIRAFGLAAWALVALAALGTERDGRPLVPFVPGVLVAALLGAALGGRLVGLWLVVSFALASWVALERSLPVLGSFPREALAPVVGLSLGAALVAHDLDRLPVAVAWFAVAGAAALVVSRVPERVVQVERALPGIVRRVLSTTLLTALWSVCALVPWVFQRLVRFDPLAAGRSSGWIERTDAPERPGRLWFADPARARPRFARRLHAKAPVAVAVLLALAVPAYSLYQTFSVPGGPLPPPANEAERRLRAAPWFDAVRVANDQVLGGSHFSQYAGTELPDHRSEGFNVTDGRRHTWRPSDCEGRRLRVWVFGGSTTFGVYLRDDDTVPSALAQAAAADGVTLDVENWGVPGDVAWVQNRRLERALAGGETPDLVVYYDGWNDLRAVRDMDYTGRGGATDFVGPMDRTQERVLTELGGLEPGKRYVVKVPDLVDPIPEDDIVDRAVASYAAADETARLLTDAHDLPFLHAYQPSLHTRPTAVDGETVSDPPARRLVTGFRARLPDDVVDLAGVFDRQLEPLFYDEVHTLPEANPTIGEALWDELAPVGRRLLALGRGDPC